MKKGSVIKKGGGGSAIKKKGNLIKKKGALRLEKYVLALVLRNNGFPIAKQKMHCLA